MPPLEDQNATPAAEPTSQGLDVNAAVEGIARDLHLVEDDPGAGEGDPAAAAAGEKEGDKTEGEGAAPAQAAPAAAVAAAPDPTDRPPDTWTKAAQEKWATVAPELKQEIRKREGDIAKYVEETRASVGVAKSFEKIVSPYLGAYRERGIDPWSHVSNLLQAHAALTWGTPQQKMEGFTALARGAGLDLRGFAQGDPNAANNQTMQYIQGLERKIAELSQGFKGVAGEIQAARQAELEDGVLKFAQDTTAHPHFWDVATEIQQFIQTGAAKSLQEAYDLAVMANPVTRQKSIEEQAAKLAAQQASAANARAVKAGKAAAVNVQSRGKGRGASPTQTIDETLKEALATIQSRSN